MSHFKELNYFQLKMFPKKYENQINFKANDSIILY